MPGQFSDSGFSDDSDPGSVNEHSDYGIYSTNGGLVSITNCTTWYPEYRPALQPAGLAVFDATYSSSSGSNDAPSNSGSDLGSWS